MFASIANDDQLIKTLNCDFCLYFSHFMAHGNSTLALSLLGGRQRYQFDAERTPFLRSQTHVPRQNVHGALPQQLDSENHYSIYPVKLVKE